MDRPTIRIMPSERRQQRVRIYGCDQATQVIVQSATWELHKDVAAALLAKAPARSQRAIC